MSRPDRHDLAVLLAWLICSVLYLWTANGVEVRDSQRQNAWHHYEYLVDGFLSGHLYLSVQPSPKLLALPDPYNPKENLHYRLWDASLYHGHYYLYYGPTPAVLLMLPWKVLTGHQLPQRLATGVFAVVGLAALALLLGGLRRRYFPDASPTLLFFTVLLAGHLSWLPVILRRPAFWELPIVTAAALLWWALYFLWRHQESGGRARWAVAAGVALAFLLGARPTYVFAAAVIALLFALPLARGTPLKTYVRRLLPVGVPLALGLAALLAYNYLRFDSIFEFGQHYQLWGMDERAVQHFSLSYVPFNAWYYLFSLPTPSPYFPFFHPGWPIGEPAGYIATEEVYGILFSMPAQLLGLAALWHLWRGRGNSAGRSLRRVLTAGLVATLCATAILFCFAGACSRYLVELLAGWSVLVGTGVLVLYSSQSGLRRPGVLRLLGIVAAVWSVLCVWLASYEFRAFARITQPEAYPIIARIFNYPSYWFARIEGVKYGPVALDIRLPAHPASGSTVLMATGSQSMVDQLSIDRIAPDRFRLRLTVNSLVMVETPYLTCRRPDVRVVCVAPWFYPPTAHPYWDRFHDVRARRLRQTLYAIEVDGVRYARQSIWGFDATDLEPTIRIASGRPTACAWVEQVSHDATLADFGLPSVPGRGAKVSP